MTTPAAGGRNMKHIQAKSGHFDKMEFRISDGDNSTAAVVIKNGWKSASGTEPNFNWILKLADGTFRITESSGNAIRTWIEVSQKDYLLLKAAPVDNDLEPDTFVIRIALRKGCNFKIQKAGELFTKAPFQAERKWKEDFRMAAKQDYIEKHCHTLEVRIPGYKTVNVQDQFDADIIRNILNNKDSIDAKENVLPYIALQRRALEGESNASEATKASLDRKCVKVQVTALIGLEKRWALSLKSTIPDDVWGLEGQQSIWLSPNTPGTAGLFDLEPTPLPGGLGGTGWKATTVIKSGLLLAILENFTTPALETAAKKTTTVYLDLKLDREDPVSDRLSLAIATLQKVLQKEQGVADVDARTYKLPLTGFFLEKKPLPTNIASFPPKLNIFLIPAAMKQYELEAESHQQAIKAAFTSPSGCALIQGPPATGKTTIVAKLLLIAHAHVNMQGKIVCSAHTNEAVQVACGRTVEVGRKMFKLEREDICLVLTRAKSQYYRLSEKEFGILEDITLDAHMKRLADATPATYDAYLAGVREINKHGRIENGSLANQYGKQRQRLADLVKARCKIFFTTLATCHAKDSFFGGESRFDCGLFVVDEASQATDIALYQAWLALDPRRVVLAGDDKQLAPYTESDEGQVTWGKSTFEKLAAKGCPSTMLNVQYRTVQNIYAGTNFHYNHLVQSHPSTVNRPVYRQLAQIIQSGKLRLIDADGQKVVVSSNLQVFHIKNSRCILLGVNHSSANPMEMQFIAGMTGALQLAGLNPSHIMALTGYKGQHTLLSNLEADYPGFRARKIDSSQGGEADIVMFSMTRTMATNIGFMVQLRRQNVGTSRAREAMFFVGDPHLFNQAPASWAPWMRSLQKVNKDIIHQVKGPVQWMYGDEKVKLPANALNV